MNSSSASNSSYHIPAGVKGYLEFINGENGKIHQEILGEAILRRIPPPAGLTVLDAGCGSGWLAWRLQNAGLTVEACDSSGPLIDYAKKKYPAVPFAVANITEFLPYPKGHFNVVTLTAASLDMEDLAGGYKNILQALKPGGKFISIIVNPYYTSPVGVWKRGWRKIFGGKPRLQLSSYAAMLRQPSQRFSGGIQHVSSRFYSLPEQINQAVQAGFVLTHLEDIVSSTDSHAFDLRYRLYRYPLFILAEFRAPQAQ